MNPTRLTFVRSVLCRHFRRDPCSIRPFKGLKTIDVGFGGGVPSEPLDRVGTTATRIKAIEKNIKVAQLRAIWNFSKSNIIFLQFRTLYRPACALRHSRNFSDDYSPPLFPVDTPPPSLLNPEPHTTNAIDNKVARVSASSSLNKLELAKFSAIADTWWDFEGPFKPLHIMNPTRLTFIRSVLCRHFRRDSCSVRPFEGLKFVDVGCGGGILSEPLARMGAIVTGIDAVEKNIKIARLHADLDPVTSSIEYCCTTAEKLVEETRKFDAVISLEVIEHVADPAEFCKSLAALCVNDGATVISTINRSMRSYATAIIAAEYILHWLPKGTHRWSSFLTPEELVLILQRSSISVEEMAGFVFNPLTGQWSLSDDICVNFIAFGTKKDN